jgi:hypothetical protein
MKPNSIKSTTLNNVKQKYNDMIDNHLKRYKAKKINEEELLILAAQ